MPLEVESQSTIVGDETVVTIVPRPVNDEEIDSFENEHFTVIEATLPVLDTQPEPKKAWLGVSPKRKIVKTFVVQTPIDLSGRHQNQSEDQLLAEAERITRGECLEL